VLLLLLAGGAALFLARPGSVTPPDPVPEADLVPDSTFVNQGLEPSPGVKVRKVEVKESPFPFVVLARAGQPEQHSATLADAVSRARSGDTIEVRGNGPFVTDPILVDKKDLVIRAGEGFAPVISLNPESSRSDYRALLTTGGSLVLEGLDLRRTFVVPKGYDESVIRALGARFLVANCRIVLRGPNFFLRGTFHRDYEVRNCLLTGNQFAITWIDPPADGSLRVENCAIGAGNGVLVIVSPELLKGQGATIRVTRNTCAVGVSSQISFKSERPEPVARAGRNPFLWEASANVFENTSHHLQLNRFVAQSTPASSEQLLRKWLTLHERNNVYGQGPFVLKHTVGLQDKSIGGQMKTLAEWRRFWKMTDADYLEGKVRYLRGDLHAKLRSSPETVTGEDFRLHPDSPGWHAGPGGRDLGADLELVGPGPAYERWKKTPEYQEWRKRTGQVK